MGASSLAVTDEVERILAAGKSVASSYFINARSWGSEVEARLLNAAKKGGVSPLIICTTLARTR